MSLKMSLIKIYKRQDLGQCLLSCHYTNLIEDNICNTVSCLVFNIVKDYDTLLVAEEDFIEKSFKNLEDMSDLS